MSINIHTLGSRKKGKKNTIINPDGKMAEWSKALDSKSSKGQLFGGSNPPLSVFLFIFSFFPCRQRDMFLHLRLRGKGVIDGN